MRMCTPLVSSGPSNGIIADLNKPYIMRNGEKTGARGKGEACDVWTEQVHEPHLNNTHTHTLKP